MAAEMLTHTMSILRKQGAVGRLMIINVASTARRPLDQNVTDCFTQLVIYYAVASVLAAS